MSVKIFLPTEVFYTKVDCDIYGEIQITDNNAISYFVVEYNAKDSNGSSDESAYEHLRHLGHISRAGSSAGQQRDVSVWFAYDEDTPNIYLLKLNIKPTYSMQVNIFLYDVVKVVELNEYSVRPATTVSRVAEGGGDADNAWEPEQCDDVCMLYYLLQECQKRAKQNLNTRKIKTDFLQVLNTPLELITRVFVLIMEWRPVTLLSQKTFLHEHYLEWRKYQASGKRNVNIFIERLLGVSVMLLLLFYVSHPGDNLLQVSHFIIQKFRLLLRSLKGSPIGLKLNENLNNFLLDCFNYHVDLWAIFIEVIKPFVRQLFIPIALVGCMGLSYQLAMLSDLLSVMGLYAYCFYTYTAALYRVELKGLQVLWKVMLGKRYNVLKKRVESHNYMNRQLYLATLFFTAFLFLFPTILVYYIVFTTLRLCLNLVNLTMHVVRRGILEFPLQSLCKWCCRRFYDTESIQLQYMPHVPSPLLQKESAQIRMVVFNLNVQPSHLGRMFSCESGLLQEFTMNNEKTCLKRFLNHILEGNF